MGSLKLSVDPNAKARPKRYPEYQLAHDSDNSTSINGKHQSLSVLSQSVVNTVSKAEGNALVDQFLKHLKIVHHLTPNQEFIQKLSNTIRLYPRQRQDPIQRSIFSHRL